MARIYRNYLTYESNYHKMIGYKDLYIDEAYNHFIGFLKYFKIYGSFHLQMMKTYGSFAQLYKIYFQKRVLHYQDFCDCQRRNGIGTTATLYPWYEDLKLLFPFLFDEDEDEDYDEAILTNVLDKKTISYWLTIKDLWLEYCHENKLYNSTIILRKIDYEDTCDTRCTWQEVLEECGFKT